MADADEAEGGVELELGSEGALVEASGGAVLGRPASGLVEVHAVASRVVLRQVRRTAAGLLRVVTFVTSP